MEFNKLTLAVVRVVDHVDHPAPFHIPDDIPSLLARESEPGGDIPNGEPVGGFSEEKGFYVVLMCFCSGGLLAGGLLLGFEVVNIVAHVGVAVEAVVEHYPFQLGYLFVFPGVIISEFVDLLFHGG